MEFPGYTIGFTNQELWVKCGRCASIPLSANPPLPDGNYVFRHRSTKSFDAWQLTTAITNHHLNVHASQSVAR
jgi:hypothetical protein